MATTDIKCVFAGNQSVGKTTIITSFLSTRFSGWISREFTECTTDFELGGDKYLLHLYNTAEPSYYSRADVFVICFSVVDPESYESVRTRWYPEVSQHGPHAPIILVGTQCDRRDSMDALRDGTVPLTKEQGESLANQIGALKYIECSDRMSLGPDAVLTEAFLTTLSARKRREYSSLLRPLTVDAATNEPVSAHTGGLFSAHLRTFKLTETSHMQSSGPGPPTQQPSPVESRRESRDSSDQPTYDSQSAMRSPNDTAAIQITDDDAYTVTSPQGLCLVINIKNYDSESFESRKGSDEDVRRVKILFEKLNFRVLVHIDLASNEIIRLLSDVAFSQVSTDHGCFVCFIMAHGAHRFIYGRDGVPLEIQSIVEKFRSNHCPSLQHRPKLFFIQACRGIRSDVEKSLASDTHDTSALMTGQHCPLDSDFLLCYANTEGYMAMRDEQAGSPYVQALCEAINENYKTENIFDMMTRANLRLKNLPINTRWGTCYMVPQMVSQLSKKCYLDPDRANPRS